MSKMNCSLPSGPSRRWLRFSLRTLAIVVTACAVLLAVCGQRFVRWRQQRSAVAELSKQGSRFTYEDGWVTFAQVIGAAVNDSHTIHLRSLPRIRMLRLEMSKVTDAGMVNLKPLKYLEHLDMSYVPIGDRGLESLETLANLKHLDVIGTRITDEGLSHLKSLAKLHVLRLADTAITDAGLEQLATMNNLQELWVQKTAVTAEGVARLQERLPSCRILTEVPPQLANSDAGPMLLPQKPKDNRP